MNKGYTKLDNEVDLKVLLGLPNALVQPYLYLLSRRSLNDPVAHWGLVAGAINRSQRRTHDALKALEERGLIESCEGGWQSVLVTKARRKRGGSGDKTAAVLATKPTIEEAENTVSDGDFSSLTKRTKGTKGNKGIKDTPLTPQGESQSTVDACDVENACQTAKTTPFVRKNASQTTKTHASFGEKSNISTLERQKTAAPTERSSGGGAKAADLTAMPLDDTPIIAPNSPSEAFQGSHANLGHAEALSGVLEAVEPEVTLEPVETVDIVDNSKNSVSGSKKPIKAKKGAFDALSLALPDCISFDAWGEFVAHRKDKRKPLTERAAKMTIRQLEKAHELGWCVTEMIQDAIANGWTGCVFDKHRAPNPNPKRPASHIIQFGDYAQMSKADQKLMDNIEETIRMLEG